MRVLITGSSGKKKDCIGLWGHADETLRRYFPWIDVEFAKRGWNLPKYIDRVYVVDKAKKILGYKASYNYSSLFQD